MSELGREELLEWLKKEIEREDCFDWNDLDEQAYEQIKALIQKPEVTEEWIEKKARELLPSIGYKVHGEYLKSHIEIAKDFIRSLVEEIHGKK